jgi:hypothetical protein
VHVVYERCAAIDVGKDEIAVAARMPGDGPDGRVTVKRTFKTFYGVMGEAARWLVSLGVTHVAMEATGVYSMPVYYALLEHGDFEKVLICNAAHVKNVPGRKTDPLTELTAAVDQVSGRAGVLVASVARHEHRRRWTAGSVPACGAAARVAGVDRGCVRAVPAGRCGWDDGRPGGSVSAGAGGVRAHGRDAAVVCV